MIGFRNDPTNLRFLSQIPTLQGKLFLCKGIIHNFFEHNGIVFLSVMGTVEEGYNGMFGNLPNEFWECRVGSQFIFVALFKFSSTILRVSMKPFSQLFGWRKVLLPQVIMEVLMAQASRPKSVHQNSIAIRWSRAIIGSLSQYLSHISGFC